MYVCVYVCVEILSTATKQCKGVLKTILYPQKASVHVCIYVCMCVCMCRNPFDRHKTVQGCPENHITPSDGVCTCMYVCVYVCMYVCIPFGRHNTVQGCPENRIIPSDSVCTCMYIYMYVCMYVCVQLLSTATKQCKGALKTILYPQTASEHVCIYICMYVCMYVCMYAYVPFDRHNTVQGCPGNHIIPSEGVCTCMYVYMYVCVYVCMYVCVQLLSTATKLCKGALETILYPQKASVHVCMYVCMY